MICYYWFFNHAFNFQDHVYNGFHDLSLSKLSVNISHIAIITARKIDYCCIIYNINKPEEVNLLENSVLEDRRHLENSCQVFLLLF